MLRAIGSLAGPHYNHDVVVGGLDFPIPGKKPGPHTAEVSADTEVWFDLMPNGEGMAYDETKVNFVPVDPDGCHVRRRSRQCYKPSDWRSRYPASVLPASVPQWIPEPTE